MTIKSTWSERTVKPRAGSVQRLVRRWYYVEGETGVSWGAHKPGESGLYTSVSQAVDTLKEAKRLMAEWRKSRRCLFWARIVRLDETKTVMLAKHPTHLVYRKRKPVKENWRKNCLKALDKFEAQSKKSKIVVKSRKPVSAEDAAKLIRKHYGQKLTTLAD